MTSQERPAPGRAGDDAVVVDVESLHAAAEQRDTVVPRLLITTIDHTRDDLRRADATAGIYIVGLAGVAALVGQIATSLHPVVKLICAAAGIPAIGVLFCSLLVFWPRNIRQDEPGPGSWVHAVAVVDAEELLGCYRAADPSRIIADQLPLLARIAKRKFRWIRPATIQMAITFGILGLALVVGIALAVIGLS